MADSLSPQALQGLSILVTRPAHQADNLAQLIALAGGTAVKFPTLAIEATDNINQIRDTLARLDGYQWLVFVSANAVNFALKANGGKISWFSPINTAAIGQATAQAMLSAGLPVDLLPQQGCTSEALLAMPALQQINGHKFLIVRGEGGRELLADCLRERGGLVDYLPVYQRAVPQADTSALSALLTDGKLAAITLTSGDALENLLVMLAGNYVQQLLLLPVVVVSARIRQMAADKGFTKIIVADGPSDRAVLAALIMLMGK